MKPECDKNIQGASQIESLDRLVIRLNPALYNSMGENLLHVEVERNQSLGSSNMITDIWTFQL